MSIYTDLAKSTLIMYLSEQKLPDMKKLPRTFLSKRAGCFVSLHKKKVNELRGCVGTILPIYKNIGGEIIANTLEAALHDPRFSPVTLDEISDLKISVDVLDEPVQVLNKSKLNIKKYGIIVKSFDGRSGLLLPNLPEIKNVDEQISIARQKAGISPDEKILMYRFTTKRYE